MRQGRVMIVPYKSDEGYWNAFGWYGVLDTAEKTSTFLPLPRVEQSRNRKLTIENAEQSGRTLLSKQQFDVLKVVVSSEEQTGVSKEEE